MLKSKRQESYSSTTNSFCCNGKEPIKKDNIQFSRLKKREEESRHRNKHVRRSGKLPNDAYLGVSAVFHLRLHRHRESLVNNVDARFQIALRQLMLSHAVPRLVRTWRRISSAITIARSTIALSRNSRLSQFEAHQITISNSNRSRPNPTLQIPFSSQSSIQNSQSRS